jgi:dolichol kinase
MFWLTRQQALIGTFVIFAFLATVDFLRFKSSAFRGFCNRFFAIFSRKEETEGGIYGSTYFMCGVFLSILLFSKEIAVASIFVLVISDTSASLVGKFLKTSKLVGEKTIAGFMAFLISAGLILVFFGEDLYFACIPTALVELFAKKIKIDDNLLIPLTCGFFCTIINYI